MVLVSNLRWQPQSHFLVMRSSGGVLTSEVGEDTALGQVSSLHLHHNGQPGKKPSFLFHPWPFGADLQKICMQLSGPVLSAIATANCLSSLVTLSSGTGATELTASYTGLQCKALRKKSCN